MNSDLEIFDDIHDDPDTDNLESYFLRKDLYPCDDYWDELAGTA